MKPLFVVFGGILILVVSSYINPHLLDLSSQAETQLPPKIFPYHVIDKINSPLQRTFQYRYDDQRTGVFRQASLKMPLREKWRFAPINFGIHGASKSSVAADEFGVVVPADSSWIYALDHNGNVQWKYLAKNTPQGFHGTPVLTRQAVFIGSYSGRIYALARRTGRPLWVADIGQTIGSSPLLFDDHLYVSVELNSPVDGYLVKLDALTGRTIWASENVGQQPHSSPTYLRELGLVYFGANNGKMMAFSDRDGAVKWQYDSLGPIKGTAASTQSNILFTTWGKHLINLWNATGQLKWSFPVEDRSQSSPTVIEDIDTVIVSANSRKIYAVTLSEGKKKWVITTDLSRLRASATAFRDQRGEWMVVTTCSLTAVCIITAKSGEIVQKMDVGDIVTSVPTVVANRIYVVTDHNGMVAFATN